MTRRTGLGGLRRCGVGAVVAGAIAAGAVAGAPREAAAGPWVKDLGHGYVSFGASYFAAEESFLQGVVTDLGFESFAYRLYAEVGLPWRLQLVMDLPYVVATNISSSGVEYNNQTLGDGRFELDVSLLDSIPLAFGVEVKVPLYESVTDRGNEGLVSVDGQLWPNEVFPDVGDDNVDVLSKVMIGYSLPMWPAWISAEVGYRVRLARYADGLHAAINLGAFVWPEHIALSLYTSGTLNVQEDPNPDVRASKEFLYMQGSVLITAAPWQPNRGLTFGVGGLLVTENTGAGRDYTVSLSYSF